MNTYQVQIRNISGRVDGMKVNQGETGYATVEADSTYEAMQAATRKLFANCKFHSEGKLGTDGTQIGSLTTGKSLYGRITCYAVPVSVDVAMQQAG